MPGVRDPRWNAMCGPAPGPGDPRIWQDTIDEARSHTVSGGVIRHTPLHPMDVAGGRSILYKPCSRQCYTLPPNPSKHGRHSLLGELYGLGTGHASKIYHPLPPAIIRHIPSANLGVALENIRAEPRSMDIWMRNGDRYRWVTGGILKEKEFAQLDRLRQQTVQTVEAELALRGQDHTRDVAPWPDLGIWMGSNKLDPFASYVSRARSIPILQNHPSSVNMLAIPRPRFTDLRTHSADTRRTHQTPSSHSTLPPSSKTPLHEIFPALLQSETYRPESTQSDRNIDKAEELASVRQKSRTPWRWRLHGIEKM